MQCTRCDPPSPLQAIDAADGFTVDFCGSCGGTWYDAGELQMTLGLPKNADINAIGIDPRTGIDCPHCQSLMTELGYPPASPVRIDYCTACSGIWLDRSELVALRKAVGAKLAIQEVEINGGEAIGVPLRFTVKERKEQFSTRHFFIALAVLSVSVIAGMGITSILAVTDHLSDNNSSTVDLIISTVGPLGGITIGAAAVGRWSEGFTIREPALAALFVLCGAAWYLAGDLGTIGILLTIVLGTVLSILGAAAGERIQTG